MGIAFLPGPNPVWGFTDNPPTGGIFNTSILYNISGFISTPGSYGVAVNAYEHAGVAYLTFTRMYGGQGLIRLYYSTSNGTAIAGVDYTAVSGTVDFPHLIAGGAITIQVPLLATASVSTTTFNFTVNARIGTSPLGALAYVFKGGNINPFPSANYTANPAFTFPVNILRQTNGIAQFTGTPYSVQRPGGTTTVTLQVQRISGFKGAVGCSFHTTDGSALAGVAYTAQTGTLSWAVGEGGPKPITITILSGGSGTQSFTVTIDTPTGGVTIGSIPIATVDITAGAPPTNPVSSGSIPDQIVYNLNTGDTTNDAVVVQPSNLVTSDYASVIGRNILCNSYPTSGPRINFFSTFWFSTTVGWIVGEGGWILKTTDGGTTWAVQSSGTNVNLRDVYFADANNGWAVGDGGIILVTANGGTLWTAQTSTVSTALYGVSFISTTVGIAVGASGVILSTANGGGLWTPRTSGVGTALNEVSYFDATHAWVVGDSGVILFSANGTSFSTQTSGVATDLNGVYFASTTVGFAVGDTGRILATSNGSTWAPQVSGTTEDLYDVNFQTTTLGWAVGAAGTILVGDGSAWTPQTSGVTVDLNAIDAASTSIAYIVGNNATFLVTGNGGGSWVNTPAPSPIGGATSPEGSGFGGGGDFATIDNGFNQSIALRFQGTEY